MSKHINIFYQMDKGFFGKTMSAFSSNANKTAKNVKVMPDSISDFCRHFETKVLNHKLERIPNKDTLEREAVSIPEMFQALLK